MWDGFVFVASLCGAVYSLIYIVRAYRGTLDDGK
jgi:hypothetical protein